VFMVKLWFLVKLVEITDEAHAAAKQGALDENTAMYEYISRLILAAAAAKQFPRSKGLTPWENAS
jgi:hypothetical protein